VRSALSTFLVERPRTLAQALRIMSTPPGGVRPTPLAGATDLLVTLNAGTAPGGRFLDLWPLRELRGIRTDARGARLGALVTFREIGGHAVLARRVPALVAAAAEIGGWQNQNRATIGGNIANASPAGDSLPVLLALEAALQVRSVRGERSVPLASLFTGYRELALEPDELITAVTIPFPSPPCRQYFRKVGTRRAQSISKVVMAAALRMGRDGRVEHVRIALGSVAPVPLRATGTEAALQGVRPSAPAAEAARAALAGDISPIDDVRSDREYRLAVAGNLLLQFLRTADPRFARGR